MYRAAEDRSVPAESGCQSQIGQRDRRTRERPDVRWKVATPIAGVPGTVKPCRCDDEVSQCRGAEETVNIDEKENEISS
jgi:hypothetical protein